LSGSGDEEEEDADDDDDMSSNSAVQSVGAAVAGDEDLPADDDDEVAAPMPATVVLSVHQPAGGAVSGVQVLSLSADNLAIHDAAYGNKEVPLFDHGNFKKGGVRGGKKSKAKNRKAGESKPPVVSQTAAAAAQPVKAKKKAGFADKVEIAEVEVEYQAGHGGEEEKAAPLPPTIKAAGQMHQLQGNPLFTPTGDQQQQSAGPVVALGAVEIAPSRASTLRRLESNASSAFGGKARKAGSISSKSSGSSKSSAASLHTKLSLFARSREGTDLTEGIRNLRLTLILVLTFVVAIAIVREFILSFLSNDFITRLDTLYQAGERRYLNYRLAVSVHMLVQMVSPLWPGNFWKQSEILQPITSKLLRDADALTWINNVLYLQVRISCTTTSICHFHPLTFCLSFFLSRFARSAVRNSLPIISPGTKSQ
jgi:hypothetical protein